MSEELPLIYKFRNVTVNSLANLANHTIWFATQASLNDPFEGLINLVKPNTEDELISFTLKTGTKSLIKQQNLSHEEAYNKALDTCVLKREETINFTKDSLNELIQNLSNERSSIGIFSTSQDIKNTKNNYPPHIANMLMWSHYADGLRGFCIKFDFVKLFESLKKPNKNKSFAMSNIKYVDSAETVKLEDLGNNALDILKSIQYKHSQWRYEHELRIFSNSYGAMKFSPEAISDFYIGEKMPDDQRLLLVGVIKQYYPYSRMHTVKTATSAYGIQVVS